MATTVLRGQPNMAQNYLERIISELVANTRRDDDRYSLGKILLKCLRDSSSRTFMKDGTTGDIVTNYVILNKGITVAKALIGNGYANKVIAIFAQNHFEYMSTFFGALFAGCTQYHLFTKMQLSEYRYYLSLKHPQVIFVDEEHFDIVKDAIKDLGIKPMIVVYGKIFNMEDIPFDEFLLDYETDEKFRPVDTEKNAVAFLIPSGGTMSGELPKIVGLTHRGIIAQIPSEWTYSNKIPKQENLCMLIYNGYWLIHILTVASCTVYGLTILTQSAPATADTTLEVVKKFKPTWMASTISDAFDIISNPKYQYGDLKCLDVMSIIGSAPSKNSLEQIMDELNPDTYVYNRYLLTEVHGYVCCGNKNTRILSVGTPLNIFLYKIIDDKGKPVPSMVKGELCVYGKHVITKTFYGADESSKIKFMEDGWIRTGDVFYALGEHLYYVDRLASMIQNGEHQIAPLEIEHAICSLEHVKAAFVANTEKGLSALVVSKENQSVPREYIRKSLAAKFPIYKHITGGIAYVDKLPETLMGKLHRRKCLELLNEEIEKKLCF